MNELLAFLDGVPVGTFGQDKRGALTFSYHPAYSASSSSPTPLSLSMPLAGARHSNRVVNAYLEGLLPDNERTRQRWGEQYGVSPNSAFALLRHLGRDAPGAVQLLQPGASASDAAARTGDVDWLTEADFEGILLDLAAHAATWGAGRVVGRWSLPGAQSKIALHRDVESGQWGVPRDSTPTTHIVKPALAWMQDHHINEALCQRAASLLGIPAAETELIEFEGVQAIVSVRYDRHRDAAGRWQRLHQEDLYQSMSVPPRSKYQADGGPGVGDIADLIARLGVDDRQASAARFFDALVYNVLIAGTDAHAKNYSMLLNGSRAQLGPLYDLASAVDDVGRPYAMAMKLGHSWTTQTVTRRDWEWCARRLGLGAGHADRAHDFRSRLGSALADAVEWLPASARGRGTTLAERILAHVKLLPAWG